MTNEELVAAKAAVEQASRIAFKIKALESGSVDTWNDDLTNEAAEAGRKVLIEALKAKLAAMHIRTGGEG